MTKPEETLSLRARQKAQTRQHLLTTATQVFSELGFHQASIDDITAAAGASRATLYSYFDSKDAILAEIIQVMWDEAEARYRLFGEMTSWTPEAVRTWISDFAHTWRHDARRNKSASEAAPPAVIGDLPAHHARLVSQVRSQPQLWSHFSTTTADARASMLVHLLQAEFTDYFFGPHDDDLEPFVAELTSAVLDLLRVPQKSPATG